MRGNKMTTYVHPPPPSKNHLHFSLLFGVFIFVKNWKHNKHSMRYTNIPWVSVKYVSVNLGFTYMLASYSTSEIHTGMIIYS